MLHVHGRAAMFSVKHLSPCCQLSLAKHQGSCISRVLDNGGINRSLVADRLKIDGAHWELSDPLDP